VVQVFVRRIAKGFIVKTSIREDDDYENMVSAVAQMLWECFWHSKEVSELNVDQETRQLMLEIHNAVVYVENHHAVTELFVEREEKKRERAPRPDPGTFNVADTDQ
jgi:hypothetical protein